MYIYILAMLTPIRGAHSALTNILQNKSHEFCKMREIGCIFVNNQIGEMGALAMQEDQETCYSTVTMKTLQLKYKSKVLFMYSFLRYNSQYLEQVPMFYPYKCTPGKTEYIYIQANASCLSK